MLAARVDLTDVVHGMKGMRGRAQNLSPVFRALRPIVAKDLQDHFKERRGDAGPWPNYARSTLEKRAGARRKARYLRRLERRSGISIAARGRARTRARGPRGGMLGRLKQRSAWTTTAGRQSLVFEHRVAWAGIHDQGGTAFRGARIPTRTFAYVDEAVGDLAAEMLRGYVVEGW